MMSGPKDKNKKIPTRSKSIELMGPESSGVSIEQSQGSGYNKANQSEIGFRNFLAELVKLQHRFWLSPPAALTGFPHTQCEINVSCVFTSL